MFTNVTQMKFMGVHKIQHCWIQLHAAIRLLLHKFTREMQISGEVKKAAYIMIHSINMLHINVCSFTLFRLGSNTEVQL